MATSHPMSPSPTPYGSVRDLPTFQQLSQQLLGMKALSLFSSELRAKAAEHQQLLDHLVSTVDDFYEQLGARNWIFHALLSTKKVRLLLDESADAAEAEERFIALYQDHRTLRWWISTLNRQPGFQVRMRQLRQALNHYEDRQFDSCTLHLIAVMDGFVNDFQPAVRKGLHARDAEDMTAWDSVVGHHMGLTHVLKTFNTSKKRRVDEEVFEVFRHGIVHGTVVNFNNVVVATKTWNMLFAVADWATATTKAAEPPEPQAGWPEAIQGLQELGRRSRYKEGFAARRLTADAPTFDQDPVTSRARALLEAWERRQWGKVMAFLPPKDVQRMGTRLAIQMIKDTLSEDLVLNHWALTSVDYNRPYCADAEAAAAVNGDDGLLRIRFSNHDAHGTISVPGTPDTDWYVTLWTPRQFFSADN
ncbi:hypothetical protein [Glycomyces albidus]|uniref:Uncharacterized protein n=1 Tax=Glycomyces albidus TaxID=2656774 RepID=A0A6L5G7M3_9ACTN|nr:hypothetical protein [Glycomyces albidus]MQM25652.1 hypothetical protein [Glycomyces albidus]